MMMEVEAYSIWLLPEVEAEDEILSWEISAHSGDQKNKKIQKESPDGLSVDYSRDNWDLVEAVDSNWVQRCVESSPDSEEASPRGAKTFFCRIFGVLAVAREIVVKMQKEEEEARRKSLTLEQHLAMMLMVVHPMIGDHQELSLCHWSQWSGGY